MTVPPEPREVDVSSAVPASGDTVSVGIALTTDPQTTTGLLEEFCVALAHATGLEVTPRGASSYRKLLDQLARGEVDLVWLPPIPALRATANHKVRPVALPVRGGASSYHAALFSQASSRIETIDDLVDVTAAWVDPQSAAGHLIIRAYLRHRGVDLAGAFTQNLFLGSHDAVAEAVTSGRADVGATYVYLHPDGGVKRAGWGERDMRVVARAGPIPNDIIAARMALSDAVVGAVQRALTDKRNVALSEAARHLLTAESFEAATEATLEPLEQLLVGLQEASDHPHSMFPPPA